MESDPGGCSSRFVAEHNVSFLTPLVASRPRSPSPVGAAERPAQDQAGSRSPRRPSQRTGARPTIDEVRWYSNGSGSSQLHREQPRQTDLNWDMSQGPSIRSRRHDLGAEDDIGESPRKRRRSEKEHERDYVLEHACSQHHVCADGTLSPAPSPPTASSSRFCPPEQHARQYSSHRCHHHSHAQGGGGGRASLRRGSTASSLDTFGLPRESPRPPSLPHGARALSRWDFAAYEPLFAHYLELTVQLRLADLDEDTVRCRWKSFVAAWNHGGLAEGWYEPAMFLRVMRVRAMEEALARAAVAARGRATSGNLGQVMTPPMTGTSMADSLADTESLTALDDDDDEEVEDEDYDYGASLPSLPPTPALLLPPSSEPTTPLAPQSGLAIMMLQGVDPKRMADTEEQESRIAEVQSPDRVARHDHAERLDEPAFPVEQMSHEPQAERRHGSGDPLSELSQAVGTVRKDKQVQGRELMGVDSDYRRMLAAIQRRRTEAELGREEVSRASAERVMQYLAQE